MAFVEVVIIIAVIGVFGYAVYTRVIKPNNKEKK